MKAEERRHEIVEMLVEEGSATLDVLAQRFAVSKMTVHRDLDDLESEGLLRKIRGGATIASSGRFESDFRFRAHGGRREAPDRPARRRVHRAGHERDDR